VATDRDQADDKPETETDDTPEAVSVDSPPADTEAGDSPPAGTEAVAPSAAPVKKGRKTAQEQAQARREAKLGAVEEQLERGGLVIRQMTEEERLRYPPRPTPVRRPGGR
jgi:hypothetical protein